MNTMPTLTAPCPSSSAPSRTCLILRARRATRRTLERGVTLVEVLIVVAILSLIAGGVAIYAIPKYQQAQKDTSCTDATTMVSNVDLWKMNHPSSGSTCPTLEDLKNDHAFKSGQNTNDPWGKPYKITCDGDGVDVISSGPDGKEGNEDDIRASSCAKKSKDQAKP